MSGMEEEAEFQLGRELLRCRRRRRSAVWLDLGGSWIHLILTPLAAALFLTLGTFAVCKHFAVPQDLTVSFTLFLFAVTAVILYAFFFSEPDAISLTLHERGFRYKKHLIRFAEVARIEAGKTSSAIAEAYIDFARLLGTIHPGARMAPVMHEISKKVTLTVTSPSGHTLIMKNALFEYQQSDLQQFFEFLRQHHPELLVNENRADDLPPTNIESARTGYGHSASIDLTARNRWGIDPTYGNVNARDARSDFAQGNYRSASLLLRSTHEPKLREFYVRSLQEWTGHPYAFEKWKREEEENANAWLVSGAHMIDWAWEARGADRAETVSQQAWSTFHERLKVAAMELERAAGLNMEDPTPHAFRLWVCIGLNASRDDTLRIFEEALSRCPDHFLAHGVLLNYLSKKWHGSHDEMFAFARKSSESAADGSLLHALIAEAHAERWLYATSFDNEPDGHEYFQRQDVRDEIIAAYARSLGSPQHVSTPLSHFAANYFAFTLARCGEWDLARAEFERIDRYPTLLPWGFEGNPHDVLRSYRTLMQESAVPVS